MAKPEIRLRLCRVRRHGRWQWFGTCPVVRRRRHAERKLRGKRREENCDAVGALADIEARELARLPTGIGELDRALGAGLVPGQVVLLGGDPGIGKSTLLLQTLATLKEVLYVTGEESAEQIAMRARRLSLDAGGVRLLAETAARAHPRRARRRQARRSR